MIEALGETQTTLTDTQWQQSSCNTNSYLPAYCQHCQTSTAGRTVSLEREESQVLHWSCQGHWILPLNTPTAVNKQWHAVLVTSISNSHSTIWITVKIITTVYTKNSMSCSMILHVTSYQFWRVLHKFKKYQCLQLKNVTNTLQTLQKYETKN